jgi:hypothetical protein
MFRPINSSESNIFTIRASIGYGSSLGVFNSTGLTNTTTYTIASSTGAGVGGTFLNYLSSPAYTNLPSGFYINYLFNTTLSTSNNIFTITYGKAFTSQPSITITPSGGVGSVPAIPIVNRASLTSATLFFATGALTTPMAISSDGAAGLLGYDIVISGPVKVGVNTGNSNKGWSFNDTTTADPSLVYTSMDVNLGGTTASTNSVVVAKNLKFLNSSNSITTYTTTTSTLDYTSTTWLIYNSASGAAIVLSTLTASASTIGMVLTIMNISSSSGTQTNAQITCIASSLTVNATTPNGSFPPTAPTAAATVQRTNIFISPGASITLYCNSATNFVVMSSYGAIGFS